MEVSKDNTLAPKDYIIAYVYENRKLPIFKQNPYYSRIVIESGQWEVRNDRILAVKGTNVVLLWGAASGKDKELLEYYANTHNGNLLLGMSDEDFNKSLTHIAHDPK